MRARLLATLESLGPAGVLAIGVFLQCAGFYFFGLVPAQRSLETKQQLAAQAARKAPQVHRVSANRDEELERFYALFPRADALTDAVERVHRFAATTGLQVTKGEYRFESSDDKLGAFHVSLPVRGSYAEIRRFIGVVLKEMPVASINTLRFERKKAGDTQLDAQIQLTIFFRPGGVEER
jgi:Tfp pilus assembly protein PilO